TESPASTRPILPEEALQQTAVQLVDDVALVGEILDEVLDDVLRVVDTHVDRLYLHVEVAGIHAVRLHVEIAAHVLPRAAVLARLVRLLLDAVPQHAGRRACHTRAIAGRSWARAA